MGLSRNDILQDKDECDLETVTEKGLDSEIISSHKLKILGVGEQLFHTILGVLLV